VSCRCATAEDVGRDGDERLESVALLVSCRVYYRRGRGAGRRRTTGVGCAAGELPIVLTTEAVERATNDSSWLRCW
jgi:hypothetical protein